MTPSGTRSDLAGRKRPGIIEELVEREAPPGGGEAMTGIGPSPPPGHQGGTRMRAHGNRDPMEIPCPIEGCGAVLSSINRLRDHLVTRHRMSPRATWPLLEPLKEQGDDWGKFKADYERICGGP